eukprot:16443239-Heterocapsa_arctica.AAC.1
MDGLLLLEGDNPGLLLGELVADAFVDSNEPLVVGELLWPVAVQDLLLVAHQGLLALLRQGAITTIAQRLFPDDPVINSEIIPEVGLLVRQLLLRRLLVHAC